MKTSPTDFFSPTSSSGMLVSDLGFFGGWMASGSGFHGGMVAVYGSVVLTAALTLDGLLTCYTMAIPFFHWTLLGDAFYATVLFGGFALAEKCLPIMQPASAIAKLEALPQAVPKTNSARRPGTPCRRSIQSVAVHLRHQGFGERRSLVGGAGLGNGHSLAEGTSVDIQVNEQVRLTEFRASDKPALVEHLNEKAIYDRTLRIPYPYTEASADEWFDIVAKMTEQQGRPVSWAIRQADSLIGGIGFDGLQVGKSHRGEVGYWLAKPFWGQGIMTAVVQEACRHAFEEFGLVKSRPMFSPRIRPPHGCWRNAVSTRKAY